MLQFALLVLITVCLVVGFLGLTGRMDDPSKSWYEIFFGRKK